MMAAILTSQHMRMADDLFGGPEGSPRTDKLIAASVQWAQEIMRKVDSVCKRVGTPSDRLSAYDDWPRCPYPVVVLID